MTCLMISLDSLALSLIAPLTNQPLRRFLPCADSILWPKPEKQIFLIHWFVFLFTFFPQQIWLSYRNHHQQLTYILDVNNERFKQGVFRLTRNAPYIMYGIPTKIIFIMADILPSLDELWDVRLFFHSSCELGMKQSIITRLRNPPFFSDTRSVNVNRRIDYTTRVALCNRMKTVNDANSCYRLKLTHDTVNNRNLYCSAVETISW